MMNKLEETISRRSFLSDSGKLIGLGILAHFTLVGKANAANFEPMTVCGNGEVNECPPKGGPYTCSTPGSHSCKTNGFTCSNKFSCTAADGHHE